MKSKWMMTTIAAFVMTPATAVLAKTEGESANVFAGTPWQSLAALVAFTLLFIALKRYAWAPILKGLQDRETKIREDLAAAEKAMADAKALFAQHQAMMAQADQEARKLIDAGRRDSELVAAQLKEQTEKEIVAMKQRARQDIHAAREQALAEIFSTVAGLTTDLAGRVLKKEINPETHRQLVDDTLAQLRSGASSN